MKKTTLVAIASIAALTLSLTACNASGSPEETTEDNFVYTTPPLTAVPITDEIVVTTPKETEAEEEISEETTTEELDEIPIPEVTTVEIQTLAPVDTLAPEVSSAIEEGVEVKPAQTQATTEHTVGAVPYETAAPGEIIYFEDGGSAEFVTGELEDGDNGNEYEIFAG